MKKKTRKTLQQVFELYEIMGEGFDCMERFYEQGSVCVNVAVHASSFSGVNT